MSEIKYIFSYIFLTHILQISMHRNKNKTKRIAQKLLQISNTSYLTSFNSDQQNYHFENYKMSIYMQFSLVTCITVETVRF